MESSPQDILEIANTDVGCSFPDPEIHPRGTNSIIVRFDNIPHEVEAGKTRLFPRYLANHIAKHLADHILTSRGKLVTDSKERPKILQEIFIKTVETFSPVAEVTEGERIAREVEEKNKTYEPVTDMGSMPDMSTGYVAPPEDTPEKEEVAQEEVKELPTNAELRAELDTLGVKYKPTDNKEALMAKIKEFAGV